MARLARPWYRKTHNMFFVWANGKQHPLGITDPKRLDLAEEAYQRLVAELTARLDPQQSSSNYSVPPPNNGGQPVHELVAGFLRSKEKRVTPETFRGYRITLEIHFLPHFGGRQISTMTAQEIEDWADRPEWSSSTRNGHLGVVQSFLRWAGHPLKLHRPPKESRGADVVLTDEQFEQICDAYDSGYGGDLVQLLRFLRATGARPGEGSQLRTEHVDWLNGCVRLKQHKTRGKTGRDRVIYLNTTAKAVLDEQRVKHTDGFLFRTRTGKPYSGKAIKDEMQKLSKRCGFRAVAYGCRHGFATDALASGIPDAIVAELLGHTSTAMVTRNYGHLTARSHVLRDAAERVAKRAG